MKAYKNLFQYICTFDNLLLSARKAARGKRYNSQVLSFFADFERQAFLLLDELQQQTYTPGAYKTFFIYESKKRMISAAPFRDRVVHHMLINIIGPLIESRFIYDTYANRPGKGTHKAIRRLQKFMQNARYVLKCDLRKYFPSIDHEILKRQLRRIIGDKRTLWLIDRIIDFSNPQEPTNWYFPGDDLFTPFERKKGLPIGNLTSQYFANYYLNAFDHFIKENLRCKYYIRYVDDFVILHDSPDFLISLLPKIQRFLNQFRVKLYKKKCQIRPVCSGQRFLGQVVFPSHRLLASENVKRFTKRMKGFQEAYQNGNISIHQIHQSIMSWLGHARQADTWKLRREILPRFVFTREVDH